MNFKIWTLVLIAVSLALSGCRIGSYEKYWGTRIELYGGSFLVKPYGRLSDNYTDEKGIRRVHFGAPYSLTVHFSVEAEQPLFRLSIKNASIVGQDDGSRYEFSEKQKDRVWDSGDSKKFGLTLGNLTKEHKFQDFLFTAEVTVYTSETEFETESVSLMLEASSYKLLHSDWLTRVMGV